MANEERVRTIAQIADPEAFKKPDWYGPTESDRWEQFAPMRQEQAITKARAIAALPVQVPDGWKMVPVEPNQDQYQAGLTAANGVVGYAVIGPIYRAMLAASPPAPASQVLTEEDEQLLAACHGAIATRTCREPQVVSRLLAIIDRLTNKDAEHG